jgi:hypothetical protein
VVSDSIITSHRPLTFAAVVAALVALATPPAASAGTASTRTISFTDRYNESGSRTVVGLRYEAGSGQRNRVTIDVDERGATIVDAAGIRSGRGCSLIRKLGGARCVRSSPPPPTNSAGDGGRSRG